MESRNILWIGLAQVLAVVFGFVLLGVVLKFHGWPEERGFHFYPLPRTMRLFGAWLLIVPLLWTLLAVICLHTETGLLSGQIAAILGIAFTALIGLLFLLAAANPGGRGILIDVSKSTAALIVPAARTSRIRECI